MENSDDKNIILNYKLSNHEFSDQTSEVVVLDDDDFIQTTLSIFANDQHNQQTKEQNNSDEVFLDPSSDLIDLTSNDDFDLYDIFMLTPDQNYLNTQINDSLNLKKETTLMVKTELEPKNNDNFKQAHQVFLINDDATESRSIIQEKKSIEKIKNSKNKDYFCPECLKYFNKSYNYKRHLFLHQIKNDEPVAKNFKLYNCPNCQKKVADRSNFLKHLRICSPEDVPSFQSNNINRTTCQKEFNCTICRKTFSKKFNLTRHLRIHFLNELNRTDDILENFGQQLNHHQESIQLYECEKCLRKFTNKQLLLDHKVKWHGTKYICKYCNDVIFSEKLDYIRHLNLNHEIKCKFECIFCKKSFPYVSQFIEHRLTHLSKWKIRQIDKINKAFEINRAESSNINKAFLMCIHCGKSFSKKFNLKRHMKKTHSNKCDDEDRIGQNFSEKQKEFFEQNKSKIFINKI